MKTRTLISIAIIAYLQAGCTNAQQKGTTDATHAVQVTNLDPSAFSEAIAKGNVQLVDVRTPGEYSGGHIAGSVNIDWMADDHETALAKLDPNVPVLLYCQAGGRSGKALEHLLAKGYKAQHLEKGFSSWQAAGMPETK